VRTAYAALIGSLSLAAGCDRVFGLEGDLHVDADVSDAHPRVDTPIEPGCTDWGPIEILSATGADPTLRFDRLEILVAGDDNGIRGKQLYHATRTSDVAPFGGGSQLSVNDFQDDWDPALSGDGLTLVWKSYRTYVPRLYVARRAMLDASFGAPSLLDANLSAEGGVDLSPDGQTVYVSSGLGTDDVLWQIPLVDKTLGTKLQVGTNIRFPSVSADGLTLYAHDAPRNLYTLTRAATDLPFDPATRAIFDTNGVGGTDPDISADNETLTYQAGGGRGIAMLRRTCSDP